MNQEAVWDIIANKWYKFRYDITKEVKEFLKTCSGKLLDVGCGSGRNFIKKENLKIYGCDFSSEMIKCAEERAKKEGMNAKLKVCPANKLPYENNFFDCVLMNAVIHCIEKEEDRKESLKEIYRVLKKGGKAFVSSWSPTGPRVKGKKGKIVVPWTVDETKLERIQYIHTKEELENMLKEVGFKIKKSWEDKNINIIVRK